MFLNIYVYRCIYVNMYICIYVYVYVYVYICIYVYVYMRICVCICVYVYTHLCIYFYDNNIYVREYVDMMLIMCGLYIYMRQTSYCCRVSKICHAILSAKTWNCLNPEYGIRWGVKTTHVGQGGSFTSWSIQRLMESINSIAEQIRFRIHFKRFRLTCLQSLHLDDVGVRWILLCSSPSHPYLNKCTIGKPVCQPGPPLEKILKVCFYSCTFVGCVFLWAFLELFASGFCIACFFFVLLWSTAIGLVLMESQLLLFNWPGTFITWCHTTWIYMDVGQNPVPPVNLKVDGHPFKAHD